jgi:hypothetical protein
MSAYLISQSAIIAAEDAYDEVATEPYEQINRGALEKAIKTYLATDPALTYAIEVLRLSAAADARAALIGLGVSPL